MNQNVSLTRVFFTIGRFARYGRLKFQYSRMVHILWVSRGTKCRFYQIFIEKSKPYTLVLKLVVGSYTLWLWEFYLLNLC